MEEKKQNSNEQQRPEAIAKSTSSTGLKAFQQPRKKSMVENQLPPEEREFYRQAIDEKLLWHVQIIDYENLYDDETRQYTSYIIEVCTSLRDYQIKRRYSDFYNFKKRIIAKCNGLKFAEFPSKRLFGSLSQAVIEKRKIQLNNEYKRCGVELIARNRGTLYFDESIKIPVCQTYTPEDEKAISLLKKLNAYSDKRSTYFDQIEEYIFKTSPKLSSAVITILLKGENGVSGIVSIAGICEGNRDTSTHVVCTKGLGLLNQLMQIENNPRADLYLDIFRKLPFKVVKSLNFSSHILSKPDKPCKKFALKLFKKCVEFNNIIDKDSQFLKYIINSDHQEVFAEYHKWIGFQGPEMTPTEQPSIAVRASIGNSTKVRIRLYQKSFQQASDDFDFTSNRDNAKQEDAKSIEEAGSSVYSRGATLMSKVQSTMDFQSLLTQENASLAGYTLGNKNSDETVQNENRSSNSGQHTNVLQRFSSQHQHLHEIKNAQDIKKLAEDKNINWTMLFQRRNGDIKVKHTMLPDRYIKATCRVRASALEAQRLYFEKRNEWDKQVQDERLLEQIDDESQIIEEKVFWQHGNQVRLLNFRFHQQIVKRNKYCIYCYKQPIKGPETDQQSLEWLFYICFKEIEEVHALSSLNNSVGSYNTVDEQGLSSSDGGGARQARCKITTIIKPINKFAAIYLSPLLLKENDSLLLRYELFIDLVEKHSLRSKKGSEDQSSNGTGNASTSALSAHKKQQQQHFMGEDEIKESGNISPIQDQRKRTIRQPTIEEEDHLEVSPVISNHDFQNENNQHGIQNENNQHDILNENNQNDIQNEDNQHDIQNENNQNDIQNDNNQNDIQNDINQNDIQNENNQN